MIRTILTLLVGFIYLYPLCPLLAVERLIFKRINPELMYKTSHVLVRGVFRVMLFTAGTKVSATGLENVPDDRPVLYVPNHRSFFDILIMFSLMKGQSGVIGKKELKIIPFLALWMDCVHGLLLDRENPREGVKTIMTGVSYLKSGASMLVFPEGTRSKEKGMLPFHEGSFKLATRSGCPVVPVAISHSDDIFEKHFPFVRKTHVTVQFAAPIECAAMSREEQKQLPSMTQEAIRSMLEKPAVNQ